MASAKEELKARILKIYVKKTNVSYYYERPLVKNLEKIGEFCWLHHDNGGFYFLTLQEKQISKETPKEKKHSYSYNYCSRCDQEFFTDRSYKRHDCNRRYYQGDGDRICDHTGVFDRPSEF